MAAICEREKISEIPTREVSICRVIGRIPFEFFAGYNMDFYLVEEYRPETYLLMNEKREMFWLRSRKISGTDGRVELVEDLDQPGQGCGPFLKLKMGEPEEVKFGNRVLVVSERTKDSTRVVWWGLIPEQRGKDIKGLVYRWQNGNRAAIEIPLHLL